MVNLVVCARVCACVRVCALARARSSIKQRLVLMICASRQDKRTLIYHLLEMYH